MIHDIELIADQVLSGNRRALAQAITLIESTRNDHRVSALQLLELLIPYSGNSMRLGISGVPGVGKSTFIESLGKHIINDGHQVAVLTVDPSSAISGGSILGDKTRMEKLSRRREAFIRPSPAGKTLGGVTRRSRETMILCEAAGFDVVLVETVGVGQSETKVSEMTDMFLLLLLPGAGDELQGIKRGIMELADILLINKADDDLISLAERAKSEYQSALQVLHSSHTSDWNVDVMTCSSRDGTGLDDVWRSVKRHSNMLKDSGQLNKLRSTQATEWMWTEVKDSIFESLQAHPEVCNQIPLLESKVSAGELPPTAAAQLLLNIFQQQSEPNE